MSMRWMICLFIILFGGCHGRSLLERTTAEALPPIMPLWERYQQCLVTTDPTELVLIIGQLEWTTLHSRRVAHDFRFRGACWWLRQQVEFLDWRMRLEIPSSPFS